MPLRASSLLLLGLLLLPALALASDIQRSRQDLAALDGREGHRATPCDMPGRERGESEAWASVSAMDEVRASMARAGPAESGALGSLVQNDADSTAGPTNGRRDSQSRPSPVAVKPDLPLFVIQPPSQVLVTVGYSSGIVRAATARVDEHDPAASGVVSVVCKSLGLMVTLVVTAVVVFLASGPGL